jgi:plastocyanin
MSPTDLSFRCADPTTSHRLSRTQIKRWIAVPVLILVAALTLAACSSGTTSAAPAKSADGTTGSTIIIKNFAFSPDSISAKPGATINVRNEDGVTHTLTADSGAFSTGNVTAGGTAHFTAPVKPGSYSYRCSIHQFMTGTLVVT